MKIGNRTVVALEYRLHLGDGETIDQSEPGAPLSYLHGTGQIVPGLERELEGLAVGDVRQVVVQPAEGYGVLDPRGLQEVPRSAFPADRKLSAGMRFSAQTEGGHDLPVRIHEVRDEVVVVDMNHPLAGKTLHFEVKVRDIRSATPEELEHGHVHGPDGDH